MRLGGKEYYKTKPRAPKYEDKLIRVLLHGFLKGEEDKNIKMSSAIVNTVGVKDFIKSGAIIPNEDGISATIPDLKLFKKNLYLVIDKVIESRTIIFTWPEIRIIIKDYLENEGYNDENMERGSSEFFLKLHNCKLLLRRIEEEIRKKYWKYIKKGEINKGVRKGIT